MEKKNEQPDWLDDFQGNYDESDQVKIIGRGGFTRRQIMDMLDFSQTGKVMQALFDQLYCDLTVLGVIYRFDPHHPVIKVRTGVQSWKIGTKYENKGQQNAAWIKLCKDADDLDVTGAVAVPIRPDPVDAVSSPRSEPIEPEVLPPETKKRPPIAFSIESSVQWHHAAQQHAQIAVVCAARSGAELLKIKAQCKHGEWLKVIKELPFGKDTARKYRDLAEQLSERLQELGNGDAFDLLELPEPEQLSDPIYAEQLEQIHEVTGEQTLRQLYFDWGITKPPKKAEYHPPKKSDPICQEELELALAESDWTEIINTLSRHDQDWMLLNDVQIQTIDDVIWPLAKQIHKAVKG